MALKFAPWLGWPIAAMLFWFWIGAKENLAAEVERCNADKLSAIAEAEQVAREATQRAAQQRISMLERQAERERKAREIAAQTASDAESRARGAQQTIRELMARAPQESDIDPKDCLNVPVPGDIIDSLRD